MAVFVGDADCQWYGYDATRKSSPKSFDELLVAAQEDNHLVARRRASCLQVPENAEGVLHQSAIGNLSTIVLTFQIMDGTLGLAMPATAADQPAYLEVGAEQWWLNLDSRGGLWINGREKREAGPAPSGEAPAAPAEGAEVAPAAPVAAESAGTAVAEAAPAQIGRAHV